ncbi:hypothetical protein FBQ96_02975 [Nitrospirales bacterium NOB]|nr:MAG: hypothetical protein UZ03_NOB001001883 [Nitrospira sp. OLB3]MDL1888540.1 hypothetical protein [Nitrospirales bacterium NOB]
MRVTAQVTVLGVDSKHSKENNRTYNKAHLFFPGDDMGTLECGIPEDKPQVLQQVKEAAGKSAQVILNIRTYKGTTFVDCVGVQVSK